MAVHSQDAPLRGSPVDMTHSTVAVEHVVPAAVYNIDLVDLVDLVDSTGKAVAEFCNQDCDEL